jgi:hypothetical protein
MGHIGPTKHSGSTSLHISFLQVSGEAKQALNFATTNTIRTPGEMMVRKRQGRIQGVQT